MRTHEMRTDCAALVEEFIPVFTMLLVHGQHAAFATAEPTHQIVDQSWWHTLSEASDSLLCCYADPKLVSRDDLVIGNQVAEAGLYLMASILDAAKEHLPSAISVSAVEVSLENMDAFSKSFTVWQSEVSVFYATGVSRPMHRETMLTEIAAGRMPPPTRTQALADARAFLANSCCRS